MSEILTAALAGAPGDELAGLPMPDTYRAALVKRSETGMFDGLESSDKDPRRSLHVEDVPLHEAFGFLRFTRENQFVNPVVRRWRAPIYGRLIYRRKDGSLAL